LELEIHNVAIFCAKVGTKGPYFQFSTLWGIDFGQYYA
jgi:hypothetical protein